MRIYETTYICPPSIEEDAMDEFSDLVRELIYDNGGKIIKQERWGKKRLAYPINHFKEGIYFYFLYGGETVKIEELERRLRLAEECVRFLTVRLDKELKGKKHKIFTQEELRLALQMDPKKGRNPIAKKDAATKDADKPAESAKAEGAVAKAAEVKAAEPVDAQVEEKADKKAEEKVEEKTETKVEEKAEKPAEAAEKVEEVVEESPAEADGTEEKTEEKAEEESE